MAEKKRSSNLELFRIVSMLLIIAHHYVVNSGLTDCITAAPLSSHSVFLLLFGMWGKTGINCFLMITGYFMCRSDISLRKYVKLLAEVLFYNIVISAIFWLTGRETFTLSALADALLPVNEIYTDFTGTFLVFYLFIPFLNILIRNMNEKQHVGLVALCVFVYVLFGTLHRIYMNYVSWFMVIYLIASYVRLYPKKLFGRKKLWGWLLLGSVLVSMASVIVCTCRSVRFSAFSTYLAYYFVSDSNAVLALVTGFCGFMFFHNLQIPYNKTINLLGSATFGVLCIHANSDTMRQWL